MFGVMQSRKGVSMAWGDFGAEAQGDVKRPDAQEHQNYAQQPMRLKIQAINQGKKLLDTQMRLLRMKMGFGDSNETTFRAIYGPKLACET